MTFEEPAKRAAFVGKDFVCIIEETSQANSICLCNIKVSQPLHVVNTPLRSCPCQNYWDST